MQLGNRSREKKSSSFEFGGKNYGNEHFAMWVGIKIQTLTLFFFLIIIRLLYLSKYNLQIELR